jgi:hypothetical protein
MSANGPHPIHSHPSVLSRRSKLGLCAAVCATVLGVHAFRVLAAQRAQLAVFRPSTGEWFIRADDGTVTSISFGAPDDVPVGRDYLGQGRAQLALFRPSTREWFIRPESGPVVNTQFGGPDDRPVPADYFGLGHAQIAVFRPTTQEWFIRPDQGDPIGIQFGLPDDQPMPADYFGLNRTQVAVYRPSTQEWFIRKDDGSFITVQWGIPGDVPVPGDYLGLRHAQIASFRPSTAEWFIRQDNGEPVVVTFGSTDDVPIARDYEGTERTKLAVFRPATQEWFLRNDDESVVTVQFGVAGDVPVPAAYGITASPPPAPPAAPSNLASLANSQSQITLTWSDNSADETGFKIERRTGGGQFAEIGSTNANVATFADTGLTAATSYIYRVRAVNAGGASGYSNETTATTQQSTSAPAAPSNLTATANSSTQITLTWSDNSADETAFKIERRTGSGSYAEVASTGSNVTSYVDASLTASTSYTYRARAVNTVGPSAYSNEASGTTQSQPAPVTLAKDVQPIFTARCATVGCHVGSRAEQGMDLSAGKAYAATVNVTAQSARTKKRVVPGDPANSFLYEKISQARPSVGSRMPAQGGALPQADIDTIRQWIEQGAKP